MKIIVPMAGMGKRMRPHTLTIPKPLIPIAGKTIVERLVKRLADMTEEKIEEVAFIIKKSFGKEVENNLKKIAANIGSEGKIFYQDEALGTAHAILCAAPSLNGKVIVAFADTLFETDFNLNSEEDGVIWVKQIDDPRQFGVVELDNNGFINNFVEKPANPQSDLAIIGIYYFKDGTFLKDELQYLIDNDIKDKGEYQLTNAMEHMKEKGLKLKPGEVKLWMDCGNKDATVETNHIILDLIQDKEDLIASDVVQENSIIVGPCYIGKNVKLKNTIIGPHVSIGTNSEIRSSVIENSIVLNDSKVENVVFKNSMIGNHVMYKKEPEDLNIGDFTKIYGVGK